MCLLQQLQNKNIILSNLKINKQASRLLDKNNALKNLLVEETHFLHTNATNRERLCCIINNIKKQPTCKMCGKPVTFNKSKGYYNSYCPNTKGNTCSGKDKNVLDRQKNTTLEKYGVENPQQSLDVRKKTTQTNLKRYGAKTPAQSEKIKRKIIQTNMKRYGVNNPMQHPAIHNKAIKTLKCRRGAEYYTQIGMTSEVIEKINNKSWLQKQHVENKKTLTDIAKMLDITPATISKYFQRYNIPVILHDVKYNTSAGEKEIIKYINEIYDGSIITKCRDIITPYELDVYIPDLNFAIEYNGIYWHSELNGKDIIYHLNKTEMCQKKGIVLIQIWDKEWNENEEIVKSRISSALQLNKKIFARKCIVREIDFTEKKKFLNKTHIQGDCYSKINLGLFYNEKLVSVMTFGKPRYNKKYQYELIRFSSLNNFSIIGAAGKIFSYFVKNFSPSSVISYADKRWGTGATYTKIGFEHIGSSCPNFFYFSQHGNSQVLYSRLKFQKYKLKNILKDYDPKLTAWENMVNNGYNRIWDCGNEIYVYLGH